MKPSTMKPRSIAWRRAMDRFVKVVASLSAMVGLVALAWILCVVIARGGSALDWSFFTQIPHPPGVAGGGLANAILGTLAMTGLGALMGVPLGLLAGVFLAEFGKASLVGSARAVCRQHPDGYPLDSDRRVRLRTDGAFDGALLRLGRGHGLGTYYSAGRHSHHRRYAVSWFPTPCANRPWRWDAPRWKVTLGIVFRAAKSGLLTGIILAVARVSGESAPLLFTALNSPYWISSLRQPTANLTVTIFQYAMSPYDDWQRMAWAHRC